MLQNGSALKRGRDVRAKPKIITTFVMPCGIIQTQNLELTACGDCPIKTEKFLLKCALRKTECLSLSIRVSRLIMPGAVNTLLMLRVKPWHSMKWQNSELGQSSRLKKGLSVICRETL